MATKKVPEFSKVQERVILGAIILMAFWCVFVMNWDEHQKAALKATSETMNYFQSFSMERTDGKGNFTQDDIKDYKVTVFNGWAPWCHNCVDEMPALQKLSEEYAAKGLQVVGVVADYYEGGSATYDNDIRTVLDNLQITYPDMLSDEEFYKNVEPMMRNAFPGTWAVDSNGKLIDFVSGGTSEEKWRELFDQWLAAADQNGG